MQGYNNAIDIVDKCKELGITHVTLYAFSTENWKRKKTEVKILLNLLKKLFQDDLYRFIDNQVHVNILGDVGLLPPSLQKVVQKGKQKTEQFDKLFLNIAFSYGGRDEIVHAVKGIIESGVASKKIDEDLFEQYLYTKNQPDPDLLIRTGGEKRISNFLLWQTSYTELYFSDVLWPDFSPNHLIDALKEYAKRKRNFGE